MNVPLKPAPLKSPSSCASIVETASVSTVISVESSSTIVSLNECTPTPIPVISIATPLVALVALEANCTISSSITMI